LYIYTDIFLQSAQIDITIGIMMKSCDTFKHPCSNSNNDTRKENAHNREQSSWKRSKEAADTTVRKDAANAITGGNVVSFRWPNSSMNPRPSSQRDWCFPPVIHWNALSWTASSTTKSKSQKKPTQQQEEGKEQSRLGAAWVETGCPRLHHLEIVPRSSKSNPKTGKSISCTVYDATVDIQKHHHYQNRANPSCLPVLGDRAEVWGHKLAAKTAVRLQVRSR
jgi:hypothetical protein